MRNETEIMEAVADFNGEMWRTSGIGCETCGGSIAAVFDRVTNKTDSLPILVIDIAHSEAVCPVLTDKGGTVPMGDDGTQVWCRHRFDDGDPAWRDPRFGVTTP